MTSYEDDLLSAFLKTQPQIKRYLLKSTGSYQDAEDITQEAWIKLARNGATALAAPVPYLMRIVRTLALDHGRGRKRRLTGVEINEILSLPEDRPDPEREADGHDQLRMLSRIMDELPDRQRKILIATRLHQRPHAEVADEFSVSVRMIEIEIHKALAYCGARLDEINRI
ncbi:RNA polymerase sigma factor [Neorhizobium sp. DT-125]|uniref:RNA polymerase sigma factor n=1 Tax=Neorhizobium sp. DT-125 TaxID=3396163 RepID=UPI003F1DE696